MCGQRGRTGKQEAGKCVTVLHRESCPDRLYFDQLSETQTRCPHPGKATGPRRAAKPRGLYTAPAHPAARVLFQIQTPTGLPGQGGTQPASRPRPCPPAPGGGQTSTPPRGWLCLPAFSCSELLRLPERAPEPPPVPLRTARATSLHYRAAPVPSDQVQPGGGERYSWSDLSSSATCF